MKNKKQRPELVSVFLQIHLNAFENRGLWMAIKSTLLSLVIPFVNLKYFFNSRIEFLVSFLDCSNPEKERLNQFGEDGITINFL